MKRTLPAYCYERRRSGGRVYIYFERGGDKPVRITEEPGTPGFAIAYAKLLNGVAPLPTTRDFKALVASYHRSARYRAIAPRTAKDYDKVTAWIVEKWGALPVSGLQRRDVIRARDAMSDKVRFANYIVQVARILMEHATDIGWIGAGTNPAKDVKLIKSERPGRKPWPQDLVKAYRAEAKGRARLIFELLLGTGMRPADALKARWDDLSDGGINVRQNKTKKPIWVPLTPALRAVLDQTPRKGLTICAQANGKPTSYRGAADLVMAVRQKIGAEAFDLYSLRHTTASELLAAGCSDEQVAAVLGHTSARTVPIYTATVRQMERAKQAQEKRK
jgi:integrase